jgi:hypothetical protein
VLVSATRRNELRLGLLPEKVRDDEGVIASTRDECAPESHTACSGFIAAARGANRNTGFQPVRDGWAGNTVATIRRRWADTLAARLHNVIVQN